ncbi:MAG: sugar porter family MFS transporter [Syntrophobacterales bacterium]
MALSSKGPLRVFLVAAVASVGGLLFGYNTAVISEALPLLMKTWGLNAVNVGVVVSAVLVGAILGAAVTGRMADFLGRRDVIMVNAGFFALGAFLSGMAPSMGWLIGGRLITGMAIGSVSLTVPLYLAEISPPGNRGALVSFNQLAITIGILIAYLASQPLIEVENGWRHMFMLGATLALFFGIVTLFLPQSPYWMVLHDDEEEARAALSSLGITHHEEVIAHIKEELTAEAPGDSWVELFRPNVRPALFVGIGLFFFQQFVGINSILYYAPRIFELSGIPSGLAFWESDIMAVVNVLMTLVAIFLVDRVGRRPLLNIGIIGMAVSLAALGYTFFQAQSLWALHGLGIASLLIYIGCFALSLGTMGWLIIAEIYPLRIRGLAMSIPTVSHWLFNGIVSFWFPGFIERFGIAWLLWLYALIAVAAWFFCRRFVPETKGLSFKAIQDFWVKWAERTKESNILYYITATVAATGGMLFGLNTGVIAGVLLLIKEQWALGPVAQGLAVSSLTGGALLGSAISGWAADLFGRRYLIMGLAVIFVVGAFANGLAPSLGWLLAARFLTGIAVGTVSLVVPLYIAEIAPAKIRGALVTMNQLALVGGILISYLINAMFANVAEGWRSMFIACAIPGVVMALGMLFLPESPRWMINRGKISGARRMLRWLGVSDPAGEIDQIRESLAKKSENKLSALLQPWMRPPLIIGFILVFIEQFTGINAVIYYAPTIFQAAGFTSTLGAIFPTVGVGFFNLIITVLAMRVVDKVGRRTLFSLGLVGLVVSLAVLGSAIHLIESFWPAKWIVVGAVLVYVSCFAMGLGAVNGLIISEIYPQSLRGLAMSVVITANYLFDIVIGLTFPTIVSYIGMSFTLWIYALVGVGGLLFCRFYLPETGKHSLEEIETHWREGRHPRTLR